MEQLKGDNGRNQVDADCNKYLMDMRYGSTIA